MTSKTSKRTLAAKERRAQIVSLRRTGASIRDIAEAVGMSPAGVHKSLTKALDELDHATVADAERYRALELSRLDRLQLAVWKSAMAGHLGAVQQCLRISQQRSKLLGLDAPTRHHVTGGMLPDDVLRGMSDDDLERLAKGEPLTED